MAENILDQVNEQLASKDAKIAELGSKIEVLEDEFNAQQEESKALKAEIAKLKKVSPNRAPSPLANRVLTIAKKKYKLKFPKVQDDKGKVDFRTLDDKEASALFERFSTNFIEA